MARKLPKSRNHPILRLAQRQHDGTLARLVDGAEAQVRAAYAEARQSVRDVVAQFARAYAAERKRLQELHEDEDPESIRVPLTWLHHSGWGERLRRAFASASETAAQQSTSTIAQGKADAASLGTQNANELLVVAMQPAIRAGMKWKPKKAKEA